MIRLIIKKPVYTYERVIFPNEIVDSKADVLRYMRFYDKPKRLEGIEWDSYITPVTYLNRKDEEIRGQYSKEVRYEVRRATREKIKYTVFDEVDINTDTYLIDDVKKKYYAFCDQVERPSMKNNLNQDEFATMIENGNIIITKAEFENGWTYHVYQVDGENALLWFSFSDYRKENANRSMAGWANRGLHDADIMYFNHKGYYVYDWGNISSKVEPNQIDKFKMAFGGELKTVYCCFIGVTLKGKALIAARRIKNAGKRE